MDKVVQAIQSEYPNFQEIPIPDKKIHRFKMEKNDEKKSCYYVGFLNFNPKDGKEFYIFEFGDWRSGKKLFFSTFDGVIDKEHKRVLKEAQEKASKEQELETIRLNEECSKSANKIWKSLETTGRTPYMDRKQISSLNGARIGTAVRNGQMESGVLFIPVQDKTEKIWGFQKIFSDGEKKLSFGIKIKGSFFILGGLKPNNEEVQICEGYATGSSIFEATKKATALAFTSGNMPNVCREFNEENQAIYCGDDDQFVPEEKGGNAGRKAAEKSPASKIIFPTFQNLDSKPTDFNDLHILEGIEIVEKQLLNSERGEYVMPLGYKGNHYFFRSSGNLQIVSISKDSFHKNSFKHLIEGAFWERNYPAANGGADWDLATDDLMKKCRRKGIFDETKIRGAGVWKDGKRFIVNLGDCLFYDGKKHSLDSLRETEFIYEQGRKRKIPEEIPLTKDQGLKLKTVIEDLLWKTPDADKILSGWLVIAPFCGILNWRPHIWLSGPKGSGKSFVQQEIINPMIREWRNYFLGQTTEAGVRQRQKSDSVPIQFDEFESNDERSAQRIQSLLELFRQASSESEGFVVKGTPGGTALDYRPRFCGIVSSIRVNLIEESDKSRFCVLELKDLALNGNPQQFEKLKKNISELEDNYALMLFSRTFSKLEILESNIEIFWKALRKENSARIAQQYGALLAGNYLLTHDHIVSESEAEQIVEKMSLDDAKANSNESESNDCLDHLLRKNIRFAMGEINIGELIYLCWQKQSMLAEEKALSYYGIRVQSDVSKLYIMNKHPELKKLFKDTPWSSGNWSKSLERIEKADKQVNFKIDQKQGRCTQLDLNVIFNKVEGEDIPF